MGHIRICHKCGERKPIFEFPRHTKDDKFKRYHICLTCSAIRTKKKYDDYKHQALLLLSPNATNTEPQCQYPECTVKELNDLRLWTLYPVIINGKVLRTQDRYKFVIENTDTAHYRGFRVFCREHLRNPYYAERAKLLTTQPSQPSQHL